MLISMVKCFEVFLKQPEPKTFVDFGSMDIYSIPTQYSKVQ